MKTIHVFDSEKAAGSGRMALGEDVDISYCPYQFQICRLPRKGGLPEWELCRRTEMNHDNDDINKKFFTIDWNQYDRIVVWFSTDTNSLLLLGFLCLTAKPDIIPVNVNRLFPKSCVEDVSPDGLQTFVKSFRRMPEFKKKMMSDRYMMVNPRDGEVVTASGHFFAVTPKSYYQALAAKTNGNAEDIYRALPYHKRAPINYLQAIVRNRANIQS